MDWASGSKISPVRILDTVSAADVSLAPGMTVKQHSEEMHRCMTARRAVDGHFLPLDRLFRPLGHRQPARAAAVGILSTAVFQGLPSVASGGNCLSGHRRKEQQ